MEDAYDKAKLPGNAGIGQLIPSEHVAVIQGEWVPSQGQGGGLSKLDHFSRKDFGKFKLLAMELRPKRKVYAAVVFTKPVTPELLQAFQDVTIQARELTQDERAAGPFYINAPSSDTRDAWHLTHGPVQTRVSFASRHKEGVATCEAAKGFSAQPQQLAVAQVSHTSQPSAAVALSASRKRKEASSEVPKGKVRLQCRLGPTSPAGAPGSSSAVTRSRELEAQLLFVEPPSQVAADDGLQPPHV